MMAAKTGRVRSQRLGEEREGRARSERRSISGPEPSLGGGDEGAALEGFGILEKLADG